MNSTTLHICTSEPLSPIVHFWLLHTAHYAENIVSALLHKVSVLAESVEQKVGVTRRLTYTWWLLRWLG